MTITRASFPMTPAQAQAVQADYAQARQLPLTYALQLNADVSLSLRLIPPGEFSMGMQPDDFQRRQAWAPANDQWSENFALPHLVRVHRTFYLGQTAVTQAQWQAVMHSNPSYFRGSGELPAENMTAPEADVFCLALAALTGQLTRLPSESEWEYACRAGSPTIFHFGDCLDDLWDYGWFRENSSMISHAVGLKRPNAWGLHEMHGGIDEYCQDPWHPTYVWAPDDQRAWVHEGDLTQRVIRGGSWYDIAGYCTSPHRNRGPLAHRSEDHGLRVVMELPIVTD
jgi:eukaryotic-like serine/threonine-protein kinase